MQNYQVSKAQRAGLMEPIWLSLPAWGGQSPEAMRTSGTNGRANQGSAIHLQRGDEGFLRNVD
ncbi:MAG: hypothetical protein WAN01_18600, partial [Bradyrhizobium sp.]